MPFSGIAWDSWLPGYHSNGSTLPPLWHMDAFGNRHPSRSYQSFAPRLNFHCSTTNESQWQVEKICDFFEHQNARVLDLGMTLTFMLGTKNVYHCNQGALPISPNDKPEWYIECCLNGRAWTYSTPMLAFQDSWQHPVTMVAFNPRYHGNRTTLFLYNRAKYIQWTLTFILVPNMTWCSDR